MPLFGLPLLWTGLEVLRLECLPYSFPYLILGTALAPSLPEAQPAALVGVYGLSFCICLVNTAMALVLTQSAWRRQVALTAIACSVFLACFLSGLVVRAWDEDVFSYDWLGVATSDESGRFEIRFTAEMFAELFDRVPDLYLGVFDATGEHELLSTSDAMRRDAGATSWFELEIPRDRLGEAARADLARGR